MITESAVQKGYAQHSPMQIASIEARYEKANKLSEKLNIDNLLWLDIGPNRGFGLKKIQLNNGRVFAVDIEKQYLSESLETNSNVTAGAVMDGCHLGFKNGQFGVISMFEVIEHVEEEEQKKLISEALRCLKPGGLFFLSTPNKTASGNRKLFSDHKKELAKDELEKLLLAAGFEMVDVLGQGFYDKSLRQRLIKLARENRVIAYIYDNLLPWSIRSRIRDAIQTSQSGDQIRKPEPDEMERWIFVVCKK